LSVIDKIMRFLAFMRLILACGDYPAFTNFDRNKMAYKVEIKHYDYMFKEEFAGKRFFAGAGITFIATFVAYMMHWHVLAVGIFTGLSLFTSPVSFMIVALPLVALFSLLRIFISYGRLCVSLMFPFHTKLNNEADFVENAVLRNPLDRFMQDNLRAQMRQIKIYSMILKQSRELEAFVLESGRGFTIGSSRVAGSETFDMSNTVVEVAGDGNNKALLEALGENANRQQN